MKQKNGKRAEPAGQMENARQWPKVVESCRWSVAEVAGLVEFLEKKQTKSNEGRYWLDARY